jgi:hypothetical protein
MFRSRLMLALALGLWVAAPLAAEAQLRPLPRPTPTPGGHGTHGGHSAPVTPQRGASDAAAAQAIREARSALSQYRGLVADFERAAADQERREIETAMEQLTANALQAIYDGVADTRRDDPAVRVQIYQIARDALGSGNRSGRIRDRIAYNVSALRKISVMSAS